MHLIRLLLVATCVTLCSSAMAQDVTYIVHAVKDPTAQYGGKITIWTANCGNALNVNLAKQEVTCKLEQNTCAPCTSGDLKQCQSQSQPKVCQFVLQSTDQPPLPLVFGWSSTNPTCSWVWDPYGRRYVYRCW